MQALVLIAMVSFMRGEGGAKLPKSWHCKDLPTQPTYQQLLTDLLPAGCVAILANADVVFDSSVPQELRALCSASASTPRSGCCGAYRPRRPTS